MTTKYRKRDICQKKYLKGNMNNYHKVKFSNEYLGQLVKENDIDKLATYFINLTRAIIKSQFVSYSCNLIDEEDAVLECVIVCLDKLPRYNLKNPKCKACNYFTTIIMCVLRQFYRKKKNGKI